MNVARSLCCAGILMFGAAASSAFFSTLVRAQAPETLSQRQHSTEANPISEVESAYMAIDFDRVLATSDEALALGNLQPRELARLYQLRGLAHAALDQPTEARDDFIRLLALHPEASLERDLAPRLRAPFLEAKGFWSGIGQRLEISAEWVASRKAFRLDLSDPIHIANAVVVSVRTSGRAEVNRPRVVTARRSAVSRGYLDVDVSPTETLHYWITLVDEHGNTLARVGSEEEPIILTPVDLFPELHRPTRSVFSSPWFWVATGAVLVAGGVTAGVLLSQEADVPIETRVSFGPP